ncbi:MULTISPECIES: hypothetical protein [Bacteria]|uniref:hypothetical protein n=1 Tax=Bacteria TaxID=2 RepID=UPI001AAF7091|nr:hypothetical protein [Massilia oculi]
MNEQIDWYLRYKSTSDVEVLKKYAKWQRKYIDYQATYAALLLGAISEEDFEKDAEQYAPDIKDLPLESIIPEIAQLESLLDFDLRTQELADYFEAEPNTINQALEQVYTYLQLKDKKIKSTEALTGKNE